MCPCYDYKCTSEGCDYFEEKNVPIADMDKPCEEPCPQCGEKTVVRIFGAPVINLGYRGSSVQSGTKVRRFQEEVLKPIKRGLGKSGRVRGIE